MRIGSVAPGLALVFGLFACGCVMDVESGQAPLVDDQALVEREAVAMRAGLNYDLWVAQHPPEREAVDAIRGAAESLEFLLEHFGRACNFDAPAARFHAVAHPDLAWDTALALPAGVGRRWVLRNVYYAQRDASIPMHDVLLQEIVAREEEGDEDLASLVELTSDPRGAAEPTTPTTVSRAQWAIETLGDPTSEDHYGALRRLQAQAPSDEGLRLARRHLRSEVGNTRLVAAQTLHAWGDPHGTEELIEMLWGRAGIFSEHYALLSLAPRLDSMLGYDDWSANGDARAQAVGRLREWARREQEALSGGRVLSF